MRASFPAPNAWSAKTARACGYTGIPTDSFDYLLNGTRVLCNPRGHAREGVNENPLFDANLLVETD
jgi:hypothetical protein